MAQAAIKPGYPNSFFKTITLPVGVDFGGQHHRDCTVGPETVEAEEKCYLALDPAIDVDLASDAYFFDVYDETAKTWNKEKNGELRAKPALTPEQLNQGRRFWQIYRQKLALCRVTKIGVIPETEAARFALTLPDDDRRAIVAAAREVDAAVAKFRDDNDAADAAKSGGGESGDSII